MPSPSDLSRAIHKSEWNLAVEVVRNNPKQAEQWSRRDGFFDGETPASVLPLHEALVAGAPKAVIRALLDANPEGLSKQESSFNRTPLHCACRKNADLEVIQHLVQRNKEACLAPDRLGRVPLHYALTNGADLDIVKCLVTTHPDAARAHDVWGWTPVHIAMSVGASQEVVKLLLDAHPESVLIRTKRGTSIRSCIPASSPLHDELLKLANETREEVHSTVKLPSLRKKSLRAERMTMV